MTQHPLPKKNPGPILTSGYGDRIMDGKVVKHYGLDWAGPGYGRGTPVLAARGGRVLTARTTPDKEAGLLVRIDHGGGFNTRYLHLDRVMVKVGDIVRMGQQIGTVGSTGRSTGPHLHFEIRINDVPVDPTPYINGMTRMGPRLVVDGKVLEAETMLINGVSYIFGDTVNGPNYIAVRAVAELLGRRVRWENTPPTVFIE